MRFIRGNNWFQAGLFAALIASIVGQWYRVVEWMDGLPHLVQLAVGTLAVTVLLILAAYIAYPYLIHFFTLLTL